MSDELTRQEVKRMVSGAIANYDRTSKLRHESQMNHMREMYGNGSGHEGFLEKAHKENRKELTAQSGILDEVKAWVDGEKKKAETAKLLEAAQVRAQVSRDKKIDRLVKYARIGGPVLVALVGKDWLLNLWHHLAQHIH